MAASTPSLGLFKLLRLASSLPRPASCYAICPGFCHSNGKHKESLKDQKHSNCQIELCQPDQLALSAPDHRAARQLREKVLSHNSNKFNLDKMDQVEKTLRDLIMNLRRRAGLRTALNFQGKAVRLQRRTISGLMDCL